MTPLVALEPFGPLVRVFASGGRGVCLACYTALPTTEVLNLSTSGGLEKQQAQANTLSKFPEAGGETGLNC